MFKSLIILTIFFGLIASSYAQDDLEKRINTFESSYLDYQQNCIDQSIHDQIKCDKLFKFLTTEQNFFQQTQNDIENEQNTSCEPEKKRELIFEIVNSFKSPLQKVTCSEEDKKYYQSTKLESLKCLMVSSQSLNPVFAKILYKNIKPDLSKFRNKDECLSMSNDCGARAMLGIAKAVQELAVGLWTIVKKAPTYTMAAARWGYNKMKSKWTSFWASSTKMEDFTSDVAQAASYLSTENQMKLVAAELMLAQNLIHGLDMWLSHNVYCARWDGVPHYSKCIQPTNPECGHLATMISGSCSLIGLLAIDLVDLLYTGGSGMFLSEGSKNLIKWTPAMANKIFNSAKVKKALVNFSKMNPKPVLKKVAQLHDKIPLKELKRVLNLKIARAPVPKVKDLKKLSLKNIELPKIENNIVNILAKPKYNKLNKARIEQAYDIANRAHVNQIRNFEGKPYIVHPDRVAKSILKQTKDEDLIIASLLHDAVEDTSITLKEIEKTFGSRVSKLVKEVTTDGAKADKIGKTQYLIKKMNVMSDDALTLKLSDRLDNLNDLSIADKDWALKYSSSTKEIMTSLKKRPLTDTHKKIIRSINEQLLSSKNSSVSLKNTPANFDKLKPRGALFNKQSVQKALADINVDINKMEDLQESIIALKGDGGTLSTEAAKKIQGLQSEMREINERVLDQTQNLFNENGIKTIVKKDYNGQKSIQLALNEISSDNPIQKLFLKIKDKYKANQITINPYQTISEGFQGVFDPASMRVEVGLKQIAGLFKDELSITSGHEIRHLIFKNKELNNKKSVFHQQFKAGSGNKLNNDNYYSSYLSAEELYNFSTDLGQVARKYKTISRKKIIADKTLISRVESSANSIRKISNSTQNLTRENLLILKDALTELKNKKIMTSDLNNILSKYNIKKERGRSSLEIQDNLGRKTTINFVSKKEKKLLDSICIQKSFTEQVCDQEKIIKVLEIAQKKQQELNNLATYQRQDAVSLINLIKNTNIDQQQKINTILKRSRELSDNVKEQYKGYLGKRTPQKLEDLAIYKDAVADNKKVFALNKFLNTAQKYDLDDNPKFLHALNDIHLTGVTKDKGLDFAKGRKVSEFLKTYPEIPKDELMKLAQKDVGVLGTAKIDEVIMIGEIGSYYPKNKSMLKKYINIDKEKNVKYLSEIERSKLEVFVDQTGKLRNASGDLIDTTHLTNSSNSLDPISAIYVMDENGKVFLHYADNGNNIKHSSILAGEPVAAAGDITVKQGVILRANNRSGHYESTSEMLDQFVNELGNRGVKTKNIKPVYFQGNYPLENTPAN